MPFESNIASPGLLACTLIGECYSCLTIQKPRPETDWMSGLEPALGFTPFQNQSAGRLFWSVSKFRERGGILIPLLVHIRCLLPPNHARI